MIDDILERAVPWGLLLGLGALVGAAFPRETRTTAKLAVRKGLLAADWFRGVGAEAYEKGQDVFIEALSEYDQLVREAQREAERSRLKVVPNSTARRRASSASNGHAPRPRPVRAVRSQSSS